MRHHVLWQRRWLLEGAAAEAQSHHRVTLRPVVPVVDVQPGEQRLAAREELLQRVQEQALAEAPRPRQKVVRTLVDQSFEVGRFVHVVAVLLPQRAEGLDADWQPESRHWPTLPRARRR